MYVWDRYFQGVPTELDEWERAAVMCKEYGWSYQDYTTAPYPLLQAIGAMMTAKARAQEKQSKR